MADLRAGLWIVRRTYHALDGLAKDEVGELVAGEKSTGQCPAVRGEDEDLFYVRILVRQGEAQREGIGQLYC